MLILSFLFFALAAHFVDYGHDKKADSSVLRLDPLGQLLQLLRLQQYSSYTSCYARSSAASSHENLLWCHALPVL